MTNPFDTHIGLKGVTPESPAPSVWINDLPGMSTELVEAVADSEDFATDDATGINATWARAKRLGLERLRSLIEGELSKSADFQYIGTRTGNLTGPTSDLLILPSAAWTGYSVAASVGTEDELLIKSLSLDSASVGSVTTSLSVFGPKGETLFTKEVTVQPGYNELLVDHAVRSRFGRLVAVFVGINTSALTLRTLGVGQDWQCHVEDHNDIGFSLEPAISAVGSINNVASLIVQGSTGTMLNAMVRRSLMEVIGRHVDRLSWGYAHLVASVLMTEKLASPNVNLFTNTNRLFTEELRTDLVADAKAMITPVARGIIAELRPTKAMKVDKEFVQGYYSDGFV